MSRRVVIVGAGLAGSRCVQTLRAKGFDFYDWAAGEIRLVTAWDSPADAVALLADAIREL